MPEKEYLSKEKYKELEVELKELKTVKRKEVAERLGHARSLGDLSENAEYHSAREEQGEVEMRIEKLDNLLKHAEIISHKKSNEVFVGAFVGLKKNGGDKVTYQIVGKEESDISAGKISYASPLGSALLGKKKKDEVTVETPKGNVSYKVVDIG